MTAKSNHLADIGLDASPAAADRPDLGARALHGLDSAIFREVQVALQAKLGRATLSVEELLALKPGSDVELYPRIGETIELRLNDTVVARGEIVAVGDYFGVRIVEISPAR